MVNDRPYHKGMPEQDAIAELRRCSGTQFDPTIVEVFTRMLEREELHDEDGLPISSAALSAPDTAQPAAEMKAEDNADKTTEWPAAEGNDSAGQADEDIDIRRLLAE